ncbi:hypothetical protein BDN70DRAFT_890881 [Pholiota conissans]|uniref:Uncharacterized protein n=1 Tax=Pholiota conissans TaxID=109636 RepID=A0A9P5ZBY6_9AGAR|nr:hypothetical protein BDN70DRAFT_890881 [Pholiota conissans]
MPHCCTGFKLTLEHLRRIASRIEAKDVTDDVEASSVVSQEAAKMGFAVIPSAILLRENMRESPPGDSTNEFILFKFSDQVILLDDESTSLKFTQCDLPRAIDWLEENGLPEISQTRLVNALCADEYL